MTPADLSLYLFYAGAMTLAVSFLLHVGHTTYLALAGSVSIRSFSGARLAGATSSSSGASATLGSDERRSDSPMDISRTLPGVTRTQVGEIAGAFSWLSLLLICISMVIRALIVGRGPWGNMYEFSIAFAFGVLVGYTVLGRRYPIRSIGFVPLGIALFLVGYAITLPSGIEPLVPALDNAPLLTIHVAMAMISYGIFATSFAAAVGYLVQGPSDRVRWLPSHKSLDEVAYRAVIIGFPIFATLIILGSWWASIAWGRYWGWDPKETSALVTWLIYAVYLHARNQRGWAGRPSALILVVGFGAVIFTYFGNLFFSGLHSYSGL